MVWVLTRRATASRLSRRPVRVGNRGSTGRPARSASQARSNASTGSVSGTARCFRPLPSQRTLAPAPRVMSAQFRPVSSETRSPVWTASSISVRSRRPSQRDWSGAATQGVDLGRGQERHDPLVEALGRDGQDALDRAGRARDGVAPRRRTASGSRSAERCGSGCCCAARFPGGSGTRRSSSRPGPPSPGSAGVLPVCAGGRTPGAAAGCRGRRDGAWAGLALLGEPVGEEGLQRRGDQGHGRAADRAEPCRAAARASSSGAAERYQ